MGEYGHSGIGPGGMVGVARLGKVTGAFATKAARGFADLLLHDQLYRLARPCHVDRRAWAALHLRAHRRQGDPDAAVQAVDKVFLGYEMPYMGHAGGLYKGVDHSEGCGVADYFRLNMELGRLTGSGLSRQGRADRGGRSSITLGQAAEWGSTGSIPRTRNSSCLTSLGLRRRHVLFDVGGYRPCRRIDARRPCRRRPTDVAVVLSVCRLREVERRKEGRVVDGDDLSR